MARKTHSTKVRNTAASYVREDERNRRRRTLTAAKTHPNRYSNHYSQRKADYDSR